MSSVAFTLIYISLQTLSYSNEAKIHIINDKKVKNEKTFAGPMGMGLAKSYEIDGKKFCVYNIIQGQKRIELSEKNYECPKNILDNDRYLNDD